MSGTRPPLDLPSTALTRGRRLRARRRVTLAASVVAASVAVGVTAPWLLSGDDVVRGDDVVATDPPAPEPRVDVPPGWWDMPSRVMVDKLTAMLPAGVVLVDTGPLEADTPEGGPGQGSINSTVGTSMDGAVVTGNVTVVLGWSSTTRSFTVGGEGPPTAIRGLPRELSCPGNLVAPTSCTEIRDEDDGRIGRRSVTALGRVTILEVALTSGDGIVHGAVANTDDNTWSADSPVTSPRPPLTMAQLETLVRDEAWTSWEP